MKVAIVQDEMNHVSLLEQIEKIKTIVHQEMKYHDVIVLGANCFTGYNLQLVQNQNHIQTLKRINDWLIKQSSGCAIIWGNISQEADGLKQACYVAQAGQLVYKGFKQVIDSRQFHQFAQCFTYSNQSALSTFKLCDKTCACVMGNEIGQYPFDEVEIIFHLENEYFIANQQRSIHHQAGKVIVSVNPISVENNGKHIIQLAGQSYVSAAGQVVMCDQPYSQQVMHVDLNQLMFTAIKQPSLFEMMIGMIKRMDKMLFAWQPKWIVGLSGGLDSSVTAGLLTIALGAKRVLGLNMATAYNSLTTKSHAKQLAEQLQIELRNGSIEALVSASQLVLNQYDYPVVSEFNLENIQARIRGHLLSSVAACEGGVVSNNTNKIESFLGYGTMYGDTIGAIGILADCTKLQVGELAQAINDYLGVKAIPHSLIPQVSDHGVDFGFKPSAELKHAQVDPMKWGYHDYLVNRLLSGYDEAEKILAEYKDGLLLKYSQVRPYVLQYDLKNPRIFLDDFNWVLNQLNKAIFKRIQSQPMLVVSSISFGLDYHEIQAPRIKSERFVQLEMEIMNA